MGKTRVYDKEEAAGFSNHMTRIRVNTDLLNPKFLAFQLHFYYLRGDYHKIMKHHVNQYSINMDRLKKVNIKVPSLDIQNQIIDEIESRFSVIDKVSEVINNALLKAERLRRSILKSAFEGKLVN